MQTFHICLWECTLAVGDESSGKCVDVCGVFVSVFRKCCEEVEPLKKPFLDKWENPFFKDAASLYLVP